VWSVLLGLPLLAGGVALHTADRYLQSFGEPVAVLGGFVILLGLVVQSQNPSPPSFRDDEDVLATKTPNQRPAILKGVVSLPCLAGAGYLLYMTKLPYAYPTAAFFVGLYLYSSSLMSYWQNALTTFYLTNQRVISVFRFLTLDRKEIALTDIRLIQEQESIWEKLVGLGNIRIAAGVEDLEIVANNIRDPTVFADQIRDRTS